jgi:hypothetical protein
METIQVVLEMKRIFRKPQIGPAQMKRSRSAVVRDALRTSAAVGSARFGGT